MCERRSNVTGSIVWYSSSMPMEREGLGKEGGPPVFGRARRRERLVDRERGYLRDDPFEIVGADRVQVGIGRGVHEVDGVRHAVLDGELHGVEVVAERLAQRDRVALDALEQAR